VEVAEDGPAGVAKFLSWRPHLIWMDLKLPGMDGLEAARHIRAMEGGRDVKIVALTAYAFSEQREEALAAGMDDFVRKPFQPETIFECLARHLSVRYLYVEGAWPSDGEPLSTEALAQMPVELRQELIGAVISLEVEKVTQLIGRVSERDPDLGRALARAANRLAYTHILQALKSVQGIAPAQATVSGTSMAGQEPI
jgi:CheY-like chemotaxis protein